MQDRLCNRGVCILSVYSLVFVLVILVSLVAVVWMFVLSEIRFRNRVFFLVLEAVHQITFSHDYAHSQCVPYRDRYYMRAVHIHTYIGSKAPGSIAENFMNEFCWSHSHRDRWRWCWSILYRKRDRQIYSRLFDYLLLFFKRRSRALLKSYRVYTPIVPIKYSVIIFRFDSFILFSNVV